MDRQELILSGIDTLASELESAGIKVKESWANVENKKKLAYVAIIMGLVKQKKDRDEESFYKGFTELETGTEVEKQKILDDFKAYALLMGMDGQLIRHIKMDVLSNMVKLMYKLVRLFYFLCFEEELKDLFPKSNEEEEEAKEVIAVWVQETYDDSSGISAEGSEGCESIVREGANGDPDPCKEPTPADTGAGVGTPSPITEGTDTREEAPVRCDVSGALAD